MLYTLGTGFLFYLLPLEKSRLQLAANRHSAGEQNECMLSAFLSMLIVPWKPDQKSLSASTPK